MIQALRTEVTTLAKCDPGDLVRELQYPSHEGFSMVAQDPKDESGVTWLLHLEAQMRSERMDNDESIPVLRYLDPLLFDVDHLCQVEIKPNRLFVEPGALVFAQSGQFLNTRIGMHGISQGLLQVDISNFSCRKYAEELKGAYFGRWSVSLVPDVTTRLDPLEIYSHEVRIT
ncbi:hypothetical protein [Roseinatronobacter sp.]|uniref:hypothetical protein n=1 Tax=Roseinatronobacter sp. TaxID=1945755 RepID=UPI0025CE2753|nr:hypothetical protein [Roseibaca sp.]